MTKLAIFADFPFFLDSHDRCPSSGRAHLLDRRSQLQLPLRLLHM
jgi:hypothetical protein